MRGKEDKEKILNSWIMAEYLKEGNIKDINGYIKIDEEDKEYYKYFKGKIVDFIENEKIQEEYKKNVGIAIYFDEFSFKDVADIIKKESKNKIKESKQDISQDISYDKKFSFVLYFDKDLKIINDKTFFTASYYIKKNKTIPNYKDFTAYFEKAEKEEIKNIFKIDEKEDYENKFNKAFKDVLDKYSLNNDPINIKKCKLKILKNIENSVDLHSFFIDDLEKAKNKEKINNYIFGIYDKKNRINLVTKEGTEGFDENIFYEILKPKNYPLGRFPSSTEYTPAFMQQVAINITINSNDNYLRSVNGPPGTGKTTLLKDIFAEFIVRQAYNISKLSDKSRKGTKVYYDEAKIGVLPEDISKYGIVVASSNNGAVKNIVDELPLSEKIDKELIKELKEKETDYFFELSNSSIKVEKKKDERGKYIEVITINKNKDNDKYWGLFSLEGGRRENMVKILNTISAINTDLEKNYKNNPSIYDTFQEKYCKVKGLRNTKQELFEKFLNLPKKEKEKNKKEDKKSELEKKIKENIYNLKEHKSSKKIIDKKIKILKDKIPSNMISILISYICKNKKYKENKERLDRYYEDLLEEIEKGEELENNNSELEKLNEEINSIIKDLKENKFREIDFSSYNNLHIKEPWFDKEFRKAQSELFILALKVRKQFLFDNKKNLKGACNILKHPENDCFEEAWEWVNLAIPVISTTFASVSNMFSRTDKEIIGNLFIDEAGQALPWASIGAMFRSKNILALGDPAQIKPVLPLDENILEFVCENYEIDNHYLTENSSVQTFIDKISDYGFYKKEDEWIGIPLWVHRRCASPIFDISNKISYGENMVQENKNKGEACWIDKDKEGSAKDKYVEKQGEVVKEKIKEIVQDNKKYMKKDLISKIGELEQLLNSVKEEIDLKNKEKLEEEIKNFKEIIKKYYTEENTPITLSKKYMKKDLIPKIEELEQLSNSVKKEIDLKNKEELEKTIKDLKKIIKKYPTEENIYVISPFINIVEKLKEKLKEINFTSYENSKPINVGTVHTFQGKEADIVFLVLGCDENSKGAAEWAVREPNIINVAASRAKKEFYIIGNKDLYSGLNSSIIEDIMKIVKIIK